MGMANHAMATAGIMAVRHGSGGSVRENVRKRPTHAALTVPSHARPKRSLARCWSSSLCAQTRTEIGRVSSVVHGAKISKKRASAMTMRMRTTNKAPRKSTNGM